MVGAVPASPPSSFVVVGVSHLVVVVHRGGGCRRFVVIVRRGWGVSASSSLVFISGVCWRRLVAWLGCPGLVVIRCGCGCPGLVVRLVGGPVVLLFVRRGEGVPASLSSLVVVGGPDLLVVVRRGWVVPASSSFVVVGVVL